MNVHMINQRRDGKITVQLAFDSGRSLKKIVSLEEYQRLCKESRPVRLHDDYRMD